MLYVGGRSGLKSEYRTLGERFGCRLLHHDGGLEQSPQHLQQLLSRADAVVCPVDCVSHDACALVKRLCRNAMAHNHPGGDPAPSIQDRELTRRIAASARELGLRVLDHLIVADKGHFSFQDAGLL